MPSKSYTKTAFEEQGNQDRMKFVSIKSETNFLPKKKPVNIFGKSSSSFPNNANISTRTQSRGSEVSAMQIGKHRLSTSSTTLGGSEILKKNKGPIEKGTSKCASPDALLTETEEERVAIGKEKLANEIILKGCVLSYIDFFYLSQRVPPSVVDVIPPFQKQYIPETLEELEQIKGDLINAEVSRRHGKNSESFKSYEKLANFYKGKEDGRTSVYFFEKCVELATINQSEKLEMIAKNHLGLLYYKLNDYDNSINYFTQTRDLALILDDENSQMNADLNLFKVHMAYGKMKRGIQKITKDNGKNANQNTEEGGENVTSVNLTPADNEEAIYHFEKALFASRKTGNQMAEADALYALGSACNYTINGEGPPALKIQEIEKSESKRFKGEKENEKNEVELSEIDQIILRRNNEAVQYLEEYESLCEDMNEVEGSANAYSALAQAFYNVANDEKAMSYLTKFLKSATELDDKVNIAAASSKLGILNTKKKRLPLALSNFKTNYDITTETFLNKETTWEVASESKIMVGIAKGNVNLHNYMNASLRDLNALINFKEYQDSEVFHSPESM